MLPQKYRFPIGVKKPPRNTYKSPYFTAKVFSNGLEVSRFGCIISKKTAKHAVSRNRVKRQFQTVFAELLPEVRPGYDILFIVQKNAVGAKTADIKDNIVHFFTRNSLRKHS